MEVDKKIMCIVLDKCSTNDAMVKCLLKRSFNTKLVSVGNFFHVRCSAHIVNLIVQKAIESIKHIIVKVRESIKFVKTSTLKGQQFKEVASQIQGPSNNVVLGIKASWNFTYIMLDTALNGT